MKTVHRPYQDRSDDFERMWAFLVEDYRDRGTFIWTLGRLGDWKYGAWSEYKYIPCYLGDDAHLWFDAFGSLAGFVVSENGDGGFTMFAARGNGFLYREILDWTVAHWSGRGRLSTEVHQEQTELLDILQEAGFAADGVVAVTQKYVLRDVTGDEVPLPEGYRIVDMDSHPDWDGKRLLQLDAFQGRSELTELDRRAYRYSRECPVYLPQYDLSILDETGRYVAGCQAFVDARNGYAEIERICTHSAYRRRGLAAAVIRACFNRLDARGIRLAYITGYSPGAQALYAKLGAVSCSSWTVYRARP
ncbi:MAG: GNAT family N-acetyltransferase [Clostridiaceae bacterium]|nr:GNAT family N-acetyltransferase [Clostridiaceae bacterium]